MSKIVKSKKRVLKNAYVVVNKYGTSGLVYADYLLAEEFKDRQERKDPSSGPWTVQPIKVMGLPSENDMDLIFDYLTRRRVVSKRTPSTDVIKAMMNHFSKGDYSLTFDHSSDMWVCRNKKLKKSFRDELPNMAIQRMIRAGAVSAVPRRLQKA